MPPLTLSPPFIRTVPPHIPLVLSLETPVRAQNTQCLQRIVVFNATLRGIFVSIAQSMSAPIVVNEPLVTPNTVAFATIVLFAATLVTPLATVWTAFVPYATTQVTSSLTVPAWRIPAAVLFLTMETLRVYDLALVVRVFKGGNVTVQGSDLLFFYYSLATIVI